MIKGVLKKDGQEIEKDFKSIEDLNKYVTQHFPIEICDMLDRVARTLVISIMS